MWGGVVGRGGGAPTTTTTTTPATTTTTSTSTTTTTTTTTSSTTAAAATSTAIYSWLSKAPNQLFRFLNLNAAATVCMYVYVYVYIYIYIIYIYRRHPPNLRIASARSCAVLKPQSPSPMILPAEVSTPQVELFPLFFQFIQVLIYCRAVQRHKCGALVNNPSLQ